MISLSPKNFITVTLIAVISVAVVKVGQRYFGYEVL
jgi:hypothetical protein